ncbi:MAG TPA: MurR/RpiR family transcriptional regulator [Chloroflexota bacterium]
MAADPKDDPGSLDLESALAANYDRLSLGKRRVIDRLLTDTRYAVVVSAPELAREVGVSESTVTRAAQALGFAGYPDLQSILRERFFGATAVPERIDASATELGEAPELAGLRVMHEDAESVRATAQELAPETLAAAVDALLAARRAYVFGARGSHGLAVMLGIGLRLLLPDTRMLSQASGDLPDQLVSLTGEDALVAISFRRVDRVTVGVLRHASRAGARTIGISDHLSSPIARYADISLVARLGTLRLMPSYAAGASLVNALTTVVSLRKRGQVKSDLRLAEELWDEFNTYAERDNAHGNGR